MPQRIPLIDRIQLDNKTCCWNWRGKLFKGTGYGKACYRGKHLGAHRLAAHLWLRHPLTDSRLVLHSCDNRACFNPKHLFVGTHLDNMRDKCSKGRHANQRKTHCKRGHEFTDDNLSKWTLKNRGTRTCLACGRIKAQARRDGL